MKLKIFLERYQKQQKAQETLDGVARSSKWLTFPVTNQHLFKTKNYYSLVINQLKILYCLSITAVVVVEDDPEHLGHH